MATTRRYVLAKGAGAHVQDGKTYREGDVVETEHRLDLHFPNKFYVQEVRTYTLPARRWSVLKEWCLTWAWLAVILTMLIWIATAIVLWFGDNTIAQPK